ncbi:AraC family transcriptional regulator [Actinoplanes sp. TBRC 11911]|uniref:AraC family transcriptional regulator n=1 Tax=Actinoplanes sp. TBRC 11911 TaxID=2729386 RepID=UPI00145ED74C|nr:AraC family transcriptional regulator [Actinoplanes sp. TBRC 11911]NMO54600.1 AraC family transcriptional regulator [Actinoplanes sp. TBRC 11911]
MLRGHMWLNTGGAEPLLLRAGDCYLLTSGDAYAVGSDPDRPADDGMAVFEAAWPDTVYHNVAPGVPGETSAISGALAFDETTAALLVEHLPAVSAIRSGTPAAAALRPVLEMLAQETSTDIPGTGAMRDHLTHILFVQTLRAVLTGAGTPTGWLRALGDERLRPALALMHRHPAEPWTLPKLAAAAGMSRSTFAQRFKDTVGLAPLDYLARWRVQSAARLLRATDRTISSVAKEFGFGTENSFIRTFKRVTGQSPARYRLNRRTERTSTQFPIAA